MTSIEAAAVTAKNTWVALAKTTTIKMTTWVSTTYTTVAGANDNCDGTAGTALTSGGPQASADACKNHCNTLKAWTMNSGDTLPEGGITAGALYCYGVSWVAGTCIPY